MVSRGAWFGIVIGLLYLAWSYHKLKWRFLLPFAALLAVAIFCFWHATPDSAPWYLKRADFGRLSSQNRIKAWEAGIKIIWDHPLGVGWNKAVDTYGKKYSPPEGGPAAIITNDYLMLGTELGLPGLLCFVGYMGLALKQKSGSKTLVIGHQTLDSLKTACRAGALTLLVAFWFDGGLFTLSTASLFWVLLELGAAGKIDGAQPTIERA